MKVSNPVTQSRTGAEIVSIDGTSLLKTNQSSFPF
jgi:hypothetical protein